jgi:hypothetical protein
MKVALSEKQLKLITSMVEADGDTSASSGADTASTASSSQSSGTQSSKAGYPAVDKWESGITRGPANPIGVAKWSDVVGAKLTRGHANPLNEVQNGKGAVASDYPKCFGLSNKNLAEIRVQPDGRYYVAIRNMKAFFEFRFYIDGVVMYPNGKMGKYTCGSSNYPIIDGKDFVAQSWAAEKDKYVTDYERNELKKIATQQAQMEKFGNFYQKYNHEVNMVLGIAAVFIPFVGPVLAAGIGGIDAKQYYDEGDTKTAGMVAMFALLPGIGKIVSKIPGVKTLGPKLMAELGKKLSLGSKAISPAEIEVVTQISQYKNLITQEIAKVGEAAAKQNVKKQLVKQAVKQKVKQKAAALGKTAAIYTGAGVTYHKGYDKIVGKPKAKDYVNRVTHSTEPPVIYKEEDMEKDEDGNWVPKQ